MTALRLTAKMREKDLPEASEVLQRSSYCDDVITGAENKAQVNKLRTDMEEVAATGGFTFKEWLESDVPSEPSTVLGYKWDTETDTIAADVSINLHVKKKGLRDGPDLDLDHVEDCVPDVLTRRHVWSAAMAVFDPLGLISPLTLPLKLCMKEVSDKQEKGDKINWEEAMDSDLRKSFIRALKILAGARDLTFPRQLRPIGNVKRQSFVAFSDGSSIATSCMVYLRTELEDTVVVQLIAAKNKVSKMTSIPRAELIGALMASRLLDNIMTGMNMESCDKVLMTDSSAVLGMLQCDTGSLGIFCGSRQREILARHPPSCWRWVPTKENPADRPSRNESTAADIMPGSMYRDGPAWLKESSTKWPVKTNFRKEDVPEEEKAPAARVALATTVMETFPVPLDKFNSFSKLTRVTRLVYVAVRAFISKLRKTTTAPPAIEDRVVARELMARAQAGCDLMSMASLVPVKTTVTTPTGVVLDLVTAHTRSPGILKATWSVTDLPILPYKSAVARAVMYDAHMATHMVGTSLHRSRSVAWITNGSELARKVSDNCMVCKKDKLERAEQVMAPVDENRYDEGPPFRVMHVDLAGPVQIVDSVKRRTTSKAWVLVCVCPMSGAVDLEVTESISAEAVLQAIMMVQTRRGGTNRIVSDHGTQMVCLAEAAKTWTWPDGPVEWEVVPPRAQWRNGLVERMIGILKTTIRRIAGKDVARTVTDQRYIWSRAAAIANSRPLAGTGRGESLALTPSDLLLGHSRKPTIEVKEDDMGKVVGRRIRQMEEVVDTWFRRFREEVVPSYLTRRKWRKAKGVPEVGDVVAVVGGTGVDERFRLGRILEVHPGDDGVVRTATVAEPAPRGEGPPRHVRHAVQNLAPLLSARDNGRP